MVRYIGSILVLLIFSGVCAQTFEMHNGDTINKRDVNNKRQGLWMKFDVAGNLEEEGKYVDNKKEGTWKGYYPSGKIKHEITYVKNRPNGPAVFYYEDGKISEQGIWKINKWVGDYKYYHENGNLAYDWKYNESGKRTGEQKYYYDDGSLMIKGDWTNGKKEGMLTELYPDGSIKSEINFNDGKIDVPSIKEYEIAEKPAKKQMAPKTQPVSTKAKSEKENLGFFTKSGYFKTYNEFKKIDREGDFENGKLINGKRYFYNDEGTLIKTLIYKEGKVVEAIDN